jgi:hypothetical protein
MLTFPQLKSLIRPSPNLQRRIQFKQTLATLPPALREVPGCSPAMKFSSYTFAMSLLAAVSVAAPVPEDGGLARRAFYEEGAVYVSVAPHSFFPPPTFVRKSLTKYITARSNCSVTTAKR